MREKRNDVKKDILLNMHELAKSIFAFVKDGSKTGNQCLIDIINAAKLTYKQPMDDFIQGMVYSRTRKRSPFIEDRIAEIKKIPGALNQVQQFKILITNGEWNIASFNTSLMIAFIKKTNAYKMPEPSLMHKEIIPRLKKLVLKQITQFIITHTPAVKTKEAIIPAQMLDKKTPGRINVENFGNIASLYDKNAGLQKPVQDLSRPGKINVANYNNIAGLFDTKPKKTNREKPNRIKNFEAYSAVANLFANRSKSNAPLVESVIPSLDQ